MSVCVICRVVTTKYKCPSCYDRYCSVACYKTHKESCSKLKKDFTPDKARTEFHDKDADLIAWERDLLCQKNGEEDAEDDKVKDELLKQLGHSAALKDMLNNPHLRAVMENLINTDRPEEAISQAMHEPIFTEFADACLQIVDHDNPNLEHEEKAS